MSLEQTKVIDFISVGKKTGIVNLTLVDPLDWSDEGRHLILLQDKINAYLQFIESGEIEQTYPASVGQKRSINIVAQHEPTKEGFRLLSLIQGSIEGAGFGFKFELRPDLAVSDED
ncbi:MAG TPA: DUF6572 domain-containing protein [Verrucomicrobiae bacterium]|jgi:hypothetical protein|nr:DUF6572 domain-containing protein [Verrucomicrobiae bacterium]